MIAPLVNVVVKLLSGRRGRRCAALFGRLVGEQAQLVDAGRTQVVHHFDDALVARARIGLDENRLIQPVGQEIFDLARQIFGPWRGRAQEVLASSGNRETGAKPFWGTTATEGLAISRDRANDGVAL